MIMRKNGIEKKKMELKMSIKPYKIDIQEDFSLWNEEIPNNYEIVTKACETTLYHQKIKSADISVLLAGNNRIADLNNEFRGKDSPTNILSFPSYIVTPDNMHEAFADEDRPMIGDIILAFEIIDEEANNQGKKIEDHITHLVIHGVLHLLGYDHIEENDAKKMEDIEIAILKSLNIENPYTGLE